MKNKNSLAFIPILIILFTMTGCNQQQSPWTSLSEDHIKAHAALLSSLEFEGRRVGTPGNEKAVSYVENHFKSIGLSPLADGSYRRDYPAAAFRWNGIPSLRVIDQGGKVIAEYAEEKDFIVRLDNNSYGGSFQGKMTHITRGAAILTTDDLFSESAVLIDFSDPDISQIQYSEDQIGNRLQAEKAKAIIYKEEQVEKYRVDLGSKNTVILNSGLMKVGVKEAVFNELVGYAEKGHRVDIQLPVEFYESKSENIYGVIPGNNPLYEEYIIIATSLDGLGTSSSGRYYPSASDNAAATALMLELARAMTERGLNYDATVVFAAFNGKHTGSVGVENYYSQKLFPPEKTKVLYLDQIIPQSNEDLLIGTYQSPYMKRTSARLMLTQLGSSVEAAGIPYESDDLLDIGEFMTFRNQGILATVITYGNNSRIGTFADTPDKINPTAIIPVGKIVLNYLSNHGNINPAAEVIYMMRDTLGFLLFGIILALYKVFWLKRTKGENNPLASWCKQRPVLFGYSVLFTGVLIMAWQARHQLMTSSGLLNNEITLSVGDFVLAFLNNIFSSVQMLTISLFFLIVALIAVLLVLQVKFSKILNRAGFVIATLTTAVILYVLLLGDLFTYEFTILWPQLISLRGSHYFLIILYSILSLLLTGLYYYEVKEGNNLKLSIICLSLFLAFITFTYSPYLLAKDLFDLRIIGGRLTL